MGGSKRDVVSADAASSVDRDAAADAASARVEAATGVRPVLPAIDAPRAVAGAVAVAAPRRRLELLIIDDEPRFLESLRLALGDEHAVETRTDAAEALELVQREPARFDVVLCDLAMPGFDGVGFFARMHAMGLGDRFVLMTGGAFTARAMDFVRSRACPSIDKPFLLERLLSLLDQVTRDRTRPADGDASR